MIEKEWTHNGLSCAVRVVEGMGHLCGYVGVPKSHPCWGIKDTQYCEYTLEVHGGVTYTKAGLEEPTPDTWWIGFDCAHYGDMIPAMPSLGGELWTLPMVVAETEHLADQLKEIADEAHA